MTATKTETRPQMRITPAGIERPALGIGQRIRIALEIIEKAYQIVRFNFKREAFGTWLGRLWLVIEPALQAGSYYFLIKFVFGLKGADTTFGFFFTAITFWRSHAVLVSSAPYFYLQRGSLYVQHNLGLGLAYTELVLQELILLVLRFAVLAVFLVVSGVSVGWSWLAIVPIAIVQFTFTLALVVWLSMAGTTIKDLGKIIGHVVWFWWYMSPGLYSAVRIPDWARPVYDLNPFAQIIPSLHQALLEGRMPDRWWGLLQVWAISLMLLWLGWKMLRQVSYRLTRYL
ncbi:MAG TPA: ABC transporter permease [Hyphomicrobiaceae bacterium]|nr:ABC transporter permease [Hyphomicrobiaceae bacterium]